MKGLSLPALKKILEKKFEEGAPAERYELILLCQLAALEMIDKTLKSKK